MFHRGMLGCYMSELLQPEARALGLEFVIETKVLIVRKHRYRSRGRCGFEDEGTSREMRQEVTAVIQVGCVGLRADEAVEGKEQVKRVLTYICSGTSCSLALYPGFLALWPSSAAQSFEDGAGSAQYTLWKQS